MESFVITTRAGDEGMTSLGNGERVFKDHPRVELYGTVDECQAHLGMARATCQVKAICEELFHLEEALSFLMGHLALYPGVEAPKVEELDALVEKVKGLYKGPVRFVRPGDSVPGAALHQARTVARRAERLAVKLLREGILESTAYIYLNRLSDALYALSLWIDQELREEASSSI